ncbi:MAG: TetR/AcrR family transcriptional regulator [Solirubrobacterales bacterium]
MEPSRREALLWAMLEELGRHGYWEMSVTRARTSVGVSSEEFEAEFDDKEKCLFAAYDLLIEQTLRKACARCDGTETWPERIRAGLERVLDELAARPEVARAMLRSFPEIGPSAYQRYLALLPRFIPFVGEGRRYPAAFEDLPPEVELLALGAAKSIIFREVEEGRTERLPRMLPEILFSILVPFLGPDRAAEEMQTAGRDRLQC